MRAVTVVSLLMALLCAADQKVAENDFDRLKGTWKLFEIETGGLSLIDNEMVDKREEYAIRFEDGNVYLKSRGKKETKLCTLSLPGSERDKPKQLDLHYKSLEGKRPESVKGIFAIEKDELKIALSLKNIGFLVAAAPQERNRKGGPGKERPKSFDSTIIPGKGENVLLVRLKRVR